jgi:hypothetical protein
MGKHNLTLEQRLKLVEWAAELLRLSEINERAEKCDPPFQVTWLQLKWVRRQSGIRVQDCRKKAYEEARARGEARQ